MGTAKKERLAEAGFKETTVQEFLDLSDADMEIINLKIKLGRLLKKLRKQNKITQAQLAKLTKTNQARIARIENADKSVSFEAILMSLYSLGAKKKDIAKVFA